MYSFVKELINILHFQNEEASTLFIALERYTVALLRGEVFL